MARQSDVTLDGLGLELYQLYSHAFLLLLVGIQVVHSSSHEFQACTSFFQVPIKSFKSYTWGILSISRTLLQHVLCMHIAHQIVILSLLPEIPSDFPLSQKSLTLTNSSPNLLFNPHISLHTDFPPHVHFYFYSSYFIILYSIFLQTTRSPVLGIPSLPHQVNPYRIHGGEDGFQKLKMDSIWMSSWNHNSTHSIPFSG